MEFFAHMNFLFWTSLFFLLGFALSIHFNVYRLKTKLNNWFLSVFSAVLPDDKENVNQELKLNMAKAATFIFYVAVFVLLISIILTFALPYSLSEEDNKYTGPLGDLFNGLLTPFLTFLTFCGLLITIMIQNVQMKATLKELRLTQEEARKSRSALEAQVNNSALQKFDNNFFSLLDNHKKVVDELMEGRVMPGYSHKEVKIGAINLYQHFKYKDSLPSWEQNKDLLLPLFLINYNLLSYLNKHIFNDEKSVGIFEFEDVKTYSNILRAILPNEILYLILVNISIGKFPEYQKLIEKFNFLEHLNLHEVDLTNFCKLINGVDIRAFGDKSRLIKYVIMQRSNNDLARYFSINVYSYLSNIDNYDKNRISVIMLNVHEFFNINFDIDFILSNLPSFFKAIVSSDINELLKLKNLKLIDLTNYKAQYL